MHFGNFFSLSFLAGGIFTIAAMLFYLFPPKKINGLYGYRTFTSMKSQEIWAFAQRFSAIAMLQSGLGLLVVSVFGFLSPLPYRANNFIAWICIFAAIILIIYRTEKAIKQQFPS